MHPRVGGAAAAMTLAVTGCSLAGCGGGLYDFPTVDGTAADCSRLVAAAPDTVAGQPTTPVDSERVAAWGDPRVELRCGVTRPEALQPTSRCDDVDGIGWFTEERDEATLFTTIGRTPAVSVRVPATVEPAAGALIDLADLVRDRTTETDPCF